MMEAVISSRMGCPNSGLVEMMCAFGANSQGTVLHTRAGS